MITLLKIPVMKLVDNYHNPFLESFDCVFYDPSDGVFIKTGKDFSLPVLNSFTSHIDGGSITIDIDFDAFHRFSLDKHQIINTVKALLDHFSIDSCYQHDTKRVFVLGSTDMAKFMFYFGKTLEK